MNSLNVNFNRVISRFESAMQQKLLIKSVLYKKVFGGKGFEFDSFRNYNFGNDDAALIDWKATMKNVGEPLVRQYVEERDLNIFIIVDVGDNMVFGSGEKLKMESAAEIAASIAHLVLISGDKVGFALYSGNTMAVRPFFSGMTQFYSFIKNITDTKIYGGKSDMKMALNRLEPYLKNSSAVFLISDFIRVDDECMKILKRFMLRHETIGVMVRDIVEKKMSDINGEIILEDIDTGEQLLIDPSLIKNEYEKYSIEQKEKILNVFKSSGAEIIEIENNQDFIVPFVDFLRKRTRKRKFVQR